MRQMLQRGNRNAMLAGFLVGWVVLLVSVGHSRSLLQPLNILMRGVQRVEQGDLDFQIPVNSGDEIGRLTSSFNKMTRTVAQQRYELRRDSITDGLTGLYNQRHFRMLLKQEAERAQRAAAVFSLLMIDIDHFKQYNDSMGHESGNEVLKAVANVLRGTLRDIDFLARYGGDEMAVILPDTSAQEARILAYRMESAVRNAHFQGEETLPDACLTLSIGGASFPRDAQSAAEMILKADQALYIAKRAGRACLRWANDVENVQKTG
jgi:diguanylate cyclase (GGDEF)-like protein